jgi:hypothetical protein
VVGIVVVLILRSTNPAAVERVGSILGEEGGDDAAALDIKPTIPPKAAPSAT